MTMTITPLSRALISTSDKTGLLPLCETLQKANVEIISTGGSARYLKEHGIAVVEVEAVTGFPEILDGRVKTLHPYIFAGILARRNVKAHIETLDVNEIDPIDLVIVNLYPFEQVIKAQGATQSDCIENIDIGGPSLIRAAAKNFDHVAVLSDPSQYDAFLSELCEHKGTTLEFRRHLSAQAYARTADYDQVIARWFLKKDLRYGENPHQTASVVPLSRSEEIPLASATPIQGKELSFNNLLDGHGAILSLRWLMHGLSENAAVIIKHGNPCGAAIDADQLTALKKAFASDPLSAFGGIVALSSTADEPIALELKNHFLEVIIAPHFSDEAKEILSQKKDLRLLEIPSLLSASFPKESMRTIFGGYLVQNLDAPERSNHAWQVVSTVAPTPSQERDLRVANSIVVPCLSNAITLVKDGQLIGVGAGQTSRVDAVKIAIAKAKEHGHQTEGAVLASDAFFPFTDSLILAKDAGITCIIEPSGSRRDGEVVAKANELGLGFVFSPERHFRH